MSKAFVKDEQDPLTADDETDDAPRPGGAAYITADGYRRLQEELDRLWHVERPNVTREVAAAAAQGDRSENAEYIFGKKRLREIDRRVRFLTKRLDALSIVVPAPEQQGRVFFGAWVTIEDEDAKTTTYRIVGSDELDLSKAWISVESPLARALLGRRVGDDVTVVRPRASSQVTVIAIRYPET